MIDKNYRLGACILYYFKQGRTVTKTIHHYISARSDFSVSETEIINWLYQFATFIENIIQINLIQCV